MGWCFGHEIQDVPKLHEEEMNFESPKSKSKSKPLSQQAPKLNKIPPKNR